MLFTLRANQSINFKLLSISQEYLCPTQQSNTLQQLRGILSSLADIPRLYSRMLVGKLLPKEWLSLSRSCKAITLVAQFCQQSRLDTPLFTNIVAVYEPAVSELVNLIEKLCNFEVCHETMRNIKHITCSG